MIPLVGATGRTAGEAVAAALQRRLRGAEPDAAARQARAADRYVELLGRSRGVLMKAGQIMSFVAPGAPSSVESAAQRSIYQSAFQRLQADAPPMEPELAASVVEAELGAPVEASFAEFAPEPIAAASIGQVHRARLHDGREVAVKVQYPGVERAIRADLANVELLTTFLRLARTTLPSMTRLDIRTIAAEVAERITEELDYRREAAHQAEFARAYRGHPFIRVPDVIPELSADRVLTSEFVDGLRWAEAIEADRELRDRWGEAIFRFAFGSLRRLRLFNADPHPGNYLFHPDGAVSFVDFGSVSRFTAAQIAVIQRVVTATVAGDADELWQAFAEMGVLDAADAPTPAEMLGWYGHGLANLTAEQPFTHTPEFAADTLAQRYSPVGEWSRVARRLQLPPEYVFLTRIDLGIIAVLGELRATGHWEAIRKEWDEGGAPATPLGVLDAEFWTAGARP
ncbi:ABC1 kinase family protein [Pseudonocardia acaciae]|uniref:ABC1 kinase family protein n=1 Tax=Pseudonocardia acaciae TaxID=551276 RepID=UPI000684ACBD|nr:AarF/ABC1/UbiB kinase family protein [Pseudonocardia acaciae]